MNNKLDRGQLIPRGSLNSEYIFESLLEQAQSKGLLSEQELMRIQQECLSLLADKVARYNAGESSSIPVEKAQSILESIFYTLGIWASKIFYPDDAVSELKKTPIKELYQKGRMQLDKLIDTTKHIHQKLLNELIDCKNVFYHGTIVDGINGFFKLYDPDYAAQEIHITADYPLFNPRPSWRGIEFIYSYIGHATYENKFCSNFSAEDIHHLLCGYAGDYPELIINIYEQVLTAALGCIIAGVDFKPLDIGEEGVQMLCGFFAEKHKGEILECLTKAADTLLQEISLEKIDEPMLLELSLPKLAANIEIAAKHDTLEHIFYRPAYPEYKTKLFVSYGEKMDNEQYRNMLHELMQCRYLEDKLAIIQETIHSLADLEDVLLDADFQTIELNIVLQTLSLPELAALWKKYQPMLVLEFSNIREQELYFAKAIQSYLSSLPQEQQKLVEQASQAIQEE